MDCSERLLGFKKPIILWLKNKHDNVPAVIEKFKTRFGEENMFPILKWTDVDPILVDQNITELYIQKFGTKDIRVSKVPHIPTYVHSVMTAHEPLVSDTLAGIQKQLLLTNQEDPTTGTRSNTAAANRRTTASAARRSRSISAPKPNNPSNHAASLR